MACIEWTNVMSGRERVKHIETHKHFAHEAAHPSQLPTSSPMFPQRLCRSTSSRTACTESSTALNGQALTRAALSGQGGRRGAIPKQESRWLRKGHGCLDEPEPKARADTSLKSGYPSQGRLKS